MIQPILSFIVPVYNVASYLPHCIDSILAIKKVEIEVILVNDGSTDDSGLICDELASKDYRVKVIHQINKGLGPSRNRGLEDAKGSYIIFVDSDDWIEADKLLELYESAKKYDAEIILGDFKYYFENNDRLDSGINIDKNIYDVPLANEDIFRIYKEGGSIVPMVWAYIYSREFIDRSKLLFDNVIHEDELWTTKALCLARRIVFTRICFYNYTQRESSIMSSVSSGKRISSLFMIAHQLLLFVRGRMKEGNTVSSDLIGFVLLRVSELYRIAFSLLSKIQDTSIVIPTHHLHSLYLNRKYLGGEVRARYMQNYYSSRAYLRTYRGWKQSPWGKSIAEGLNADEKLILIFNLMWSEPLEIPLDMIPQGYRFTTDRKYLRDADLVVFHLPTLSSILTDDLEKPECQKWVGWSLECEENYPFMKDREFMEIFDYKMTYHKNADIVFPYYEAHYETTLAKCRDIKPAKDICMLISSPFNLSKRQEYLAELMQCISIDSYGRLFNNVKLKTDNGRVSKLRLYEQYKFVIAFENSCASDYVTEKFFDPLLSGAIPIYLGADNIEEFSPGDNCYIDVRQFPNPKDLAEYLKTCIHSEEVYNKHHRWRKVPINESFKELLNEQKINPFVRLCSLI